MEFAQLRQWSMIKGENDWVFLCQLLRGATFCEFPGVCVDFGTGGGGTAMLLSAIFSNREVHSIDTFQGIPDPSSEDRTNFEKGAMRCNYDEIRRRMDVCGYPEIKLYQNLIESWCTDRLDQEMQVVASIIDANLYEPTCAALRWLLQPGRVPHGGVICCDDLPYQGVKTAIEEVCGELEVSFDQRGRLAWIHP